MAIDESGPHSLRALLRPAPDPPMRDPQRTREQAAQALQRAAAAIQALRAQAGSEPSSSDPSALDPSLPGPSRDQPTPERRARDQQVRTLSRQLTHRYHWLAELHRTLAAGDDAELARAWSRFFACYDDFLEAWRQARTELEERTPPESGAPAATPGTDGGEA